MLVAQINYTLVFNSYNIVRIHISIHYVTYQNSLNKIHMILVNCIY